MRLSIIVPVYNMAGEGKLDYCIQSLLGQNMTEYEIIAVDDASTDTSVEILKQYEKKYPHILKVICSAENRKQGGARNLGLKHATGEWIGFVDADDWIHPDMYRRMLDKAEETGADVVGCQYSITTEHSMEVGRVVQVHRPGQAGVLCDEKKKLWIMNPGSMVIKVYKKEIIDKNALHFPENTFYEDNMAAPLWMLCFQHFELIDEPLYYYYQHPGSTVHVISLERCHNRMDMAVGVITACKEQGIFDTFKKELEIYFTQIYYVNTLFSYMQTVKQPNFRFLKELQRGMRFYFPNFRENDYYEKKYDAEQKRMINYHMKNILWYVIYDRMLRTYRRLRYGKSKN